MKLPENYLRLSPQVTIEEHYRYRAIVRETATTTPAVSESGSQAFEGKVRIEIPYCPNIETPGKGERGAISDLARFNSKGGRGLARCGFAAFHAPDLGGDHDRPLEHIRACFEKNDIDEDVLPLDIQIRDLRSLQADDRCAVFEAHYPLTQLAAGRLDVRLEASLEDDYQVRDGGGQALDPFQSFEKFQTLQIRVIVRDLKKHSEKTDAPASWGLVYLALDWPREQLAAVDLSYGNYFFVPQMEQLIIAGGEKRPVVSTQRSSDGNDPNISEFKFEIRFGEPNRLAEIGELTGKVMLVPAAVPGGRAQGLSGVGVTIFDAAGFPTNSENAGPHVARNGITIDYQISLAHIFRKRQFLAQRHLTFEAVIPEASRFEDIRSALMDVGIKIDDDSCWFQIGDNPRQRGLPNAKEVRTLEQGDQIEVLIRGSKQISGSKCDPIVLRALGELQHARRTLALQGGGATEVDVSSGKIEIDVGARYDDHKQLNALFDDLNKLLRERLARFRIL